MHSHIVKMEDKVHYIKRYFSILLKTPCKALSICSAVVFLISLDALAFFPPTIYSVKFSPSSVHSGGSSTLSWSSDASFCELQNAGTNGYVSNSGSKVFTNITSNLSITVRCGTTMGQFSSKSATVIVAVPVIPSSPSTINIPSTDSDGSFPVTWSESSGAWKYIFEREVNSKGFLESFTLDTNIRNKPQSGLPNGTYRFRVKACNTLNQCSPWRTSGNVSVTGTSSGNIHINKTTSSDGNYRVSWSGVNSTLGAPKLYENGVEVTTVAGSGYREFYKTQNGTFSYDVRDQSCISGNCSSINTIGPQQVMVSLDDIVPISSNMDLLPVSAVGAMSYSANVNGKGDAVISVPLEVIPGVNEHQPKLSIEYSSNRFREIIEDERVTEDSIGSGWSLQGGASQIHHCFKGIPGAYTHVLGNGVNPWGDFDLSNFCLDGEPVLAVPPVDQIDGFEINEFDPEGVHYVLWNNPNVRVIRFKTSPGQGDQFIVYYPNGSKAEYGHTSNSNMQWQAGSNFVMSLQALNKYTDAFGNETEYSYLELPSEKKHLIKQIRYGNSQDAVIDFEYEQSFTADPVDPYTPIPGGHYGDNINQPLRLVPTPYTINRITMSLNSQLVREYRLRSESLNGDWTRLTDIQQCAYDSASVRQCIEPLAINWQGGADKYKTRVSSLDNGLGRNTEYVYTNMTAPGNEANFSERPFGNATLPEFTQNIEAQEGSILLQTVVTELKQNDGVGGTRKLSYAYQGRGVKSHEDFNWGFLGFYAQRIKDDSTDIYQYVQYSLNHRIKDRASATITTLGQYGHSDYEILSRSYSRYELASVYHGKHKQYNGFTEIVKPMRSNNAYASESLSFAYESGQLISASHIENNPQYVIGSDGITGIWIEGGGPTATLEYPLQSKTVVTRALNPSNVSLPSASDWGFYAPFSYGSVLRSTRKVTSLIENRLLDDYYIGFADRIETSFYDGDTNTAPVQTTLSTAEQFITGEGKTTLNQRTSTAFDGDTDIETTLTNSFNSSGLLTSTTTRDANGTLLSSTSQSDFLAGRFPQTLSNALGHETSVSYDMRLGLRTESIDANLLSTKTRHDAFGRVYEVENSDGVIVSTARQNCADVGCPTVYYNGKSIIPHLVITESSLITPTSKVYVDELGRTVRTATQSFDGTWVYADTSYNAIGQVTASSNPYFSSATPQYTTYEYDELGRVSKVTSPDGGTVETAYSVAGNSLVVTTTKKVLDHDGSFVESKVKRIEHNALGEVQKVYDAYGHSSLQSVTEFDYYATGQAKEITVNGQWAADFVYDAAGNRIRLNDQSIGHETVLYNGIGQKKQVTDALNNTIDYTYDLLGRIKTETSGDGVQRWYYDPSMALGALDYVEFDDNRSGYYHKQSMTYSADSKLTNTRTQIQVPSLGTKVYHQSFTYDSYGRSRAVTFPSGASATTHYNGRGFVSQVTDGDGNKLHSVSSADAFGNVTNATFGNSLSTSRAYDVKSGSLKSIKSFAGSSHIQNSSYKWRSDGFMQSRRSVIGGTKEEGFTYDALSRLRTSSTTNSTTGQTRTTTTDYSLNGNIRSKTASNNAGMGEDQVTAYQYGTTSNAGPNAVSQVRINGINNTLYYNGSGAIILYDAATGADKFIDWTKRGKPSRITKGSSSSTSAPEARDEFAYGVGGFRYYKKATWKDSNNQLQTEHTFYVGNYEDIAPANDPNYARVERTQLTDKAMGVRTTTHFSSTSHNVEFLHKDHLGSIDAVTDASGIVLHRLAFDTFGSRKNANWLGKLSEEDTRSLLEDIGGGINRGYTGHEQLDRTGLIHMNGRVFDPILGRFLSPDPLVQAPHFSQSYNRYTYTFNNPLAFVDPTGYGSDDPQPEPTTARERAAAAGRHDSGIGYTISFGGGYQSSAVWAGENLSSRNMLENSLDAVDQAIENSNRSDAEKVGLYKEAARLILNNWKANGVVTKYNVSRLRNFGQEGILLASNGQGEPGLERHDRPDGIHDLPSTETYNIGPIELAPLERSTSKLDGVGGDINLNFSSNKRAKILVETMVGGNVSHSEVIKFKGESSLSLTGPRDENNMHSVDPGQYIIRVSNFSKRATVMVEGKRFLKTQFEVMYAAN